MLQDGLDVSVGGADGYAEAGGGLRERVVPTTIDQAYQGTLVGRRLATAVTLAGGGEHGYPLEQSLRQTARDKMGSNSSSAACAVPGAARRSA